MEARLTFGIIRFSSITAVGSDGGSWAVGISRGGSTSGGVRGLGGLDRHDAR